MEINKIYNENCLDTMAMMPDGFVDLIVTSPPYDNLRDYKGYSFQFEEIAKELFRVTKTGGVVVWIVADETKKFCESLSSFKQAIFFVEHCGFNLLDTMIYHKSNYAPAYPTLRRYANTFEYMFILSKGKPKTFNPIQQEKVLKNYRGKNRLLGKKTGHYYQRSLIVTGKQKMLKMYGQYAQRNQKMREIILPCSQNN